MQGLNKRHTVQMSMLQKCLQAEEVFYLFFLFCFFLEVLTPHFPLLPVFMLSAFN